MDQTATSIWSFAGNHQLSVLLTNIVSGLLPTGDSHCNNYGLVFRNKMQTLGLYFLIPPF